MPRAGRPLGEIVSQLPAYAMIKRRYELEPRDGSAAARAFERVTRRFAEADLNTDDGLRLDLDDGWVHLRPSNTEPIMRLIAEARTTQRTQELVDEVSRLLAAPATLEDADFTLLAFCAHDDSTEGAMDAVRTRSASSC